MSEELDQALANVWEAVSPAPNTSHQTAQRVLRNGMGRLYTALQSEIKSFYGRPRRFLETRRKIHPRSHQ